MNNTDPKIIGYEDSVAGSTSQEASQSRNSDHPR